MNAYQTRKQAGGRRWRARRARWRCWLDARRLCANACTGGDRRSPYAPCVPDPCPSPVLHPPPPPPHPTPTPTPRTRNPTPTHPPLSDLLPPSIPAQACCPSAGTARAPTSASSPSSEPGCAELGCAMLCLLRCTALRTPGDGALRPRRLPAHHPPGAGQQVRCLFGAGRPSPTPTHIHLGLPPPVVPCARPPPLPPSQEPLQQEQDQHRRRHLRHPARLPQLPQDLPRRSDPRQGVSTRGCAAASCWGFLGGTTRTAHADPTRRPSPALRHGGCPLASSCWPTGCSHASSLQHYPP